MLLVGRFTEYPFFLLQEIFHHRRETGLLEVTSGQQSGYLYVKNGEIKAGAVGKFRGAKAIEVVRNLSDASFQFKSLEPSDYARIVWERSFGFSRAVAATPSSRPEVFRTRLTRVLSFGEVVNEILQLALLSLAQGATRQIRLYASVAYNGVKKLSSAAWRRTLNANATTDQFLRRAQRKLLLALKTVVSQSSVAQRRAKTNFKYSHPSHRVSSPASTDLINKSEPRLRSLKALPQKNIFLVFVSIAVFYGTLVVGFYYFPLPEDRVDTASGTEENVGPQSPSQRRKVSPKRAKRKRRNVKTTPQKKKDGTLVEEQKFLLDKGAVPSP